MHILAKPALAVFVIMRINHALLIAFLSTFLGNAFSDGARQDGLPPLLPVFVARVSGFGGQGNASSHCYQRTQKRPAHSCAAAAESNISSEFALQIWVSFRIC